MAHKEHPAEKFRELCDILRGYFIYCRAPGKFVAGNYVLRKERHTMWSLHYKAHRLIGGLTLAESAQLAHLLIDHDLDEKDIAASWKAAKNMLLAQ